MKILIIDDKKDNLVSLTAMLRAFLPGCETACAQSGPEGIEAARSFQPDTILLDIQMPGMDGFQVCHTLKNTPASRHIPIIFLTAQKTDSASHIRGLEIGGDAFLTKPVEPGKLMAQIRAMVRIKKTEDALREEKNSLERVVSERTAALEAETATLDTIFDSSPVAMLVLDRQANIIRVNSAAATLAGGGPFGPGVRRPGDVLQCVHAAGAVGCATGAADREFFSLSSLEGGEEAVCSTSRRLSSKTQGPPGCGNAAFCAACPLRKGLETALSSGVAVHGLELELEVLRNGLPRTMWFKMGAETIQIAGERKIILALDDITRRKRMEEERKLTEESLARDEARLRRAEQIAGFGNWEICLATEEVHASENTRRIYGLFHEHLSLADVRMSVLPEYRPMLDEAFENLIEKGHPYDVEFKIRRAFDGQIVSIHSIAEFDPVNRIIFGVVHDISQCKQAESRNRELADLLDQTSDAIFVRTMEGAITFWNKGAEKLFGWTAQELQGRTDKEVLITSATWAKVAEAEQQVLREGRWIGEMNFISKSGRRIIGQTRATMTKHASGARESLLVLVTDITEKKQIEAQFLRAQRMESIGTLASGVAHDLNNVLAPILMALPLLRHGLEPEELRQTIDALESSVMRGARVVKQLLTFGRGLGGERVTIDFRHLLKDLEHMTRETFPKNITLDFQTVKDLWPLQGDPTQCHQALLNLCINARDAMAQGGTLRVKTENRLLDENFASLNPGAKPGPYISVEVSDSGTGIPPEHLEKIFDPFFTTKDYGKGTGLGLPTVIGIIKSHGGFITVTSALGQGSTFQAFLPASPKAPPASIKAKASALPRGCGETILVVDDETAVRDMTQRLLIDHGYHVLCAVDGAEALVLFARDRQSIRLVLTDYMMPNLDGLALARGLRRLDSKVKIILTSGLGDALDEVTRIELRALGVDKQITKACSAEALLTVLHTALQGAPYELTSNMDYETNDHPKHSR